MLEFLSLAVCCKADSKAQENQTLVLNNTVKNCKNSDVSLSNDAKNYKD